MAWAEAVTALSAALIAVMLVICGIGLLFFFGELRRLAAELRRLTGILDHDARPALLSIKTMVEDAGKTVAAVKNEVEGFSGTSRGLRERIERAADAVEDRLLDLDALVDVLQDEVEGTALDIAAALRTTRRGGKLLRRVRRAIAARRR
ncbi:MAG: hypothetical protein JSW71_23685 [Gemmatimonadota bacterium]|nr:MAG: hypothetical protein JSW71_23685 [Gemmatimonadota bacterium]